MSAGPAMVVVTGGSVGIGRAILERFREDGAFGINLARRPSGLPGVVDLAVDFRDHAWEAALPERLLPLVEGKGPLCLVHNAAHLQRDTATGLDGASLREVLDVNVVAPAALNRILDGCLVQRSSIVYIGSTLSEMAVPGSASYAVSKHAIVGLMRSTCQDLEGRGVHTVAVCPGFTDTDMLRIRLGEDPVTHAEAARRSTFGRLVQPREIADTVAWCARSPVLNGAVIHANLGQRSS
jgi:3-oxoacyl-[acyl-carrier protein] reductase